MLLSAWLALLLAAAPHLSPAPPPNPALARAEQHLAALRFHEALAALEEALAVPDNPRSTLLRALELRGTTAAVLDRHDTSLASFRQLLTLEPSFTLPPDQSPRIRARFAQALEWLAGSGPLRFEAHLVPGRSAAEAVVQADPLGMARGVRFHFLLAGGRHRTVGGALEGQRVEVEVPSGVIEGWWAELLGDRDGVLARVGAPDALLALAPAPTPSPPPQVRPWRWAAYGLWGAAGAALAGGVVFGLRSEEARTTLASAERDPRGRVVGLTQVEAHALQGQSRGDASLANLLFGAGAALALTGGGAWWWDQRLHVAPTPTGLAVTGELP